MAKKKSKMWIAAMPVLAMVAVAVLIAVLLRAYSIKKNEGTEGISQDAGSFLRYVWLELVNVFKFSRY
jgi:hypothetical protein